MRNIIKFFSKKISKEYLIKNYKLLLLIFFLWLCLASIGTIFSNIFIIMLLFYVTFFLGFLFIYIRFFKRKITGVKLIDTIIRIFYAIGMIGAGLILLYGLILILYRSISKGL